jgi:hypothetical protein
VKNKVFQESGVTTIALDDLGTSTPLESNKSLVGMWELLRSTGLQHHYERRAA